MRDGQRSVTEASRRTRGGREIGRETARALEEGIPTIVAAGGDGTICGIAAQLAGTGSRMGVLPLGTFNYFARSLGLPEELEEAVRVVAEGHLRAIPVGEVNGRVFLNNASLGAYAAILFRRERVYRRWGRSRLAAYWSVITTLLCFRVSLDATVTVDGAMRQFRTPLIFVAKNAHQLDHFELAGADCVRAGFDAEVARKVESLIYISEYKRFQSAPGARLSERAFWLDRRYPIVNRWRDPG